MRFLKTYFIILNYKINSKNGKRKLKPNFFAYIFLVIITISVLKILNNSYGVLRESKPSLLLPSQALYRYANISYLFTPL